MPSFVTIRISIPSLIAGATVATQTFALGGKHALAPPECRLWNVLRAARWKYSTLKIAKKSPSRHHPTTLSGYIFAIKACIDNRKNLLSTNISPHMPLQYGERRPTSGWDRFVSLGHPSKFQRLLRLDSITARQSSSGRQPKFVAFSRGRHLHSAGQPSGWALAHILVSLVIVICCCCRRCCCKVLVSAVDIGAESCWWSSDLITQSWAWSDSHTWHFSLNGVILPKYI